MAEADLDAVIRQIAKAQNKSLMSAARKRSALYLAKAAKASDKEAKTRFKLMARSTMDYGLAAARRLQNSADNTADSYARAIKNAAEEIAAMKPVKKAGKMAVKKAAKKAT
jgi:predicted component of type VI protein secretion system